MKKKYLKMKKKYFILLLLVIVVVGIIGYNYIYQDHRDISNETATSSLNSSSLIEKFLSDPAGADQLYLDKTIEVTGTITSIEDSDLVLDEKIFCTFETLTDNVQLGATVTVKGRYIGFDDLLEEVKIDQCSIVK